MKCWQAKRILCVFSTDVFFHKCRTTVMSGMVERREIHFKKLAHTIMKVKIRNLQARMADWRLKEELSPSSKAAGRFHSSSRESNVFNWDQILICKTQQYCRGSLFHVDTLDLNINSLQKNTLTKISRRYFTKFLGTMVEPSTDEVNHHNTSFIIINTFKI